MSKIIITFAKNWRGYAAGEIAGFDETTASALIESGYAEELGKKPSKSGKAAKPATKPGKDAKAQTSAAPDDSANAADDEKP